ncbi:nitrogen assimilation transcription factor nit-4 [Ophiostoma piceae UAMH 11346]|uniref:Nitrogen assimilation transcription factor nit-4 n=1 Tax=Ophiostoma piceae (strain UAMH 11346) TaxID=1262450 RepID=S3D9J1_OPHP1|nr:nitrogen assimilation transcription factor nit-4 [Ophiostoma piceae UAMH 11346]
MILGRSSKPRSRASIACAGCRSRRTKCIIADGQSSCERCSRLNRTCVLRDDDERKRPVTKAQVNALIRRIGSLEQRLSDAGLDIPPVLDAAPLTTQHEHGQSTTSQAAARDDGADTSTPGGSLQAATASDYGRGATTLQVDGPSLPYLPHTLDNSLETRPTWTQSLSQPPVQAHSANSSSDYGTGPGSGSNGSVSSASDHQGTGPSATMDESNSSRMTPATSASGPASSIAVYAADSFNGHLPSSTGSMRGPGGHSRFVGITTNCHMYSNMYCDENKEARLECEKDVARTRSFLAAIPYEAHRHLIHQFWNCYNSIIHIVHRGAFETDSGDTVLGAGLPGLGGPSSGSYYTPYLHVCILAVGFRYADRTRPEIHALATPEGESLLHDEAKRLADYELKVPGGVPSVQSLLLMGDLECGVGRYSTGWMYAGMACRLIFDLGLNRQCGQQAGQSLLDMEVKRTVLFASIVIDRFWGLFLGRPTSIKFADISISNGPDQLHPMHGCLPMGLECRFETEIYESLIRLTNTASKLTDAAHRHYTTSDPSSYYFVTGLHRELRAWYCQLPRHLRWTPTNLARNPPSAFFNLHQQYHTLFILMYRPFLSAGKAPPVGTHNTGGGLAVGADEERENDYADRDGNEQDLGVDSVMDMARKTCFAHAIEIARIYEVFCARFEYRTMFVTGMQHAATAAFAIVDGLEETATTDKPKLAKTLLHLQRLAESLYAHASVYYPARVMTGVLFRVLGEYRQARQHEQQVQQNIALQSTNAKPSWPAMHALLPTDQTKPQPHPPQAASYAQGQPSDWTGLIHSNGRTASGISAVEHAHSRGTLQALDPGKATNSGGFADIEFDSDTWESIMNTLSQPVRYGV